MLQTHETQPGRAGLGETSFPGRNGNRENSNSLSQKKAFLNLIDFATTNHAALGALPAVLSRILPGERHHGREYTVLIPRRADRRAGSFKINLSTGQWADFATGDKGGDHVSLVAYVENVSQVEAARKLARMLGIETGGRRNG